MPDALPKKCEVTPVHRLAIVFDVHGRLQRVVCDCTLIEYVVVSQLRSLGQETDEVLGPTLTTLDDDSIVHWFAHTEPQLFCHDCRCAKQGRSQIGGRTIVRGAKRPRRKPRRQVLKNV